jgi:hypothetical protein
MAETWYGRALGTTRTRGEGKVETKGHSVNGTKKSLKACLDSFSASRLGMCSERLCLSLSHWRRSLPEWVPSLEARNQLGQGLYLNLVLFDTVFLEECLKQEPRTYNSSQLARKLESDRVIIRHNCFLKIYAAEVSSPNVGSSKVSSSKIRPCQIRISQVSPTQVSLTQISLT